MRKYKNRYCIPRDSVQIATFQHFTRRNQCMLVDVPKNKKHWPVIKNMLAMLARFWNNHFLKAS
ncbi:MAG: hypothetical protein C4527_23755 [Candidatus Omnitrophota bacterium]|nr:MAG: hypothetical protein C4527_23755 [Candidatus Omnitrophota bacterium]